MKHYGKKLLLQIGGTLAFIIGILGFFIPGLPGAPFMILASWCFARSSPRFHQYLLNHKHFGHALRQWETHRRISRKAKYLSCSMISLSILSSTIIFGWQYWWISGIIALTCGSVMYWLWQLPEYQ